MNSVRGCGFLFTIENNIFLGGFLTDHSERAKRPVNDDSQDNYSQQKGKYQLIGIKPFQNYNPIAGLFLIQSECGVKNTNCKFSVFFFDNAGNPDFRCADHYDIDIFFGQRVKHNGCNP